MAEDCNNTFTMQDDEDEFNNDNRLTDRGSLINIQIKENKKNKTQTLSKH